LGFLALLGAIGARTGGANILRAMARVTFWGALAMAITAGIGKVFGTLSEDATAQKMQGCQWQMFRRTPPYIFNLTQTSLVTSAEQAISAKLIPSNSKTRISF
jgi:hypothetical protein